MKNKCAKILVMLILSVITINYIGSTVLAAYNPEPPSQIDGQDLSYAELEAWRSEAKNVYDKSLTVLMKLGLESDAKAIETATEAANKKIQSIRTNGQTTVTGPGAIQPGSSTPTAPTTPTNSTTPGSTTTGPTTQSPSTTQKTQQKTPGSDSNTSKNKTENPGDKVGDKSAKDKENELMEKAGDSAISSAMGTIADGIALSSKKLNMFSSLPFAFLYLFNAFLNASISLLFFASLISSCLSSASRTITCVGICSKCGDGCSSSPTS